MLNSDVLSQLKQLKKDIREANNQHEGTVKGSPGRFGFVVLNDGRECFLSPDEMQKVYPGDRVLAEVSQDDKGRDVASVISLQDSTLSYFVGRYLTRGKGHFVEPDLPGLNRWIFIPPQKRRQANVGDYILCKTLQHPFKEGKPQAEIVKVLGKGEESGLPTDYVLAKYNLGGKQPGKFNFKELQQRIDNQIARRKDLRDLAFVTIDAATTMDMDDALYAEDMEDGGWKLVVAIADPAELVDKDSDADKYARRLGSSYYFPDRVISMLHPKLANELCSLQAEQDRLALVCQLEIDATGQVLSSSIEEAVIQSKAKLAYDEVSLLFSDPEQLAGHPNAEQLKRLRQVTDALAAKRQTEALVTDEKPEYRLTLDDNKKIAEIVRKQSTPAHRVIEEAMIAANRAAAAFLEKQARQALFASHPGFRPERLEQLKQVVQEQCPDFDTNQLEKWDGYKRLIQHLAEKPAELPVAAIASRMLTRSTLSKQPVPHAGMGLPAYTTFTSPIRKYADLTVHRIIKAVLRNESSQSLSNRHLERLQEILRNGRMAVNESEHWLKCEFAKTLIDQPLAGQVQHTNGSGFQVRLLDTGIDGNINLGELAEKFKFDGVHFRHIGETRSFCLEQEVLVKIKEVDMDSKQITMVLVD